MGFLRVPWFHTLFATFWSNLDFSICCAWRSISQEFAWQKKKLSFSQRKYWFSMRRFSAGNRPGNDNSAPAEDVHNKSPSLVALRKNMSVWILDVLNQIPFANLRKVWPASLGPQTKLKKFETPIVVRKNGAPHLQLALNSRALVEEDTDTWRAESHPTCS